jgi:enoyl-CoA hydratase
MSFEAFSIDIRDGIAEVRITTPACGPAFWRECPDVFKDLDDNDDVRVVLLRGPDKCFSYGLDLMAMAGELGEVIAGAPNAEQRTKLLGIIEHMQGSPNAPARMSKPVIAAVHHWCIGAGLDLISGCDIRVCSASAKFSLREVRVGMVADVGSLQRLPAIIGEGATRELAFTGKDIDAERALRLGLVSEVFDDDDALWAGARALAADVAKNSPLVVRGIKNVMNRRLEAEVRDGLQYVAAWNSAYLPSEDLMEAMAAFAEKREPVFKGR